VINFEIDTEGEEKNAMDKQKLQQLITMSEERCPAICSMSHIIKVTAKLK
jgi:uncharacterized OsmC-like protein